MKNKFFPIFITLLGLFTAYVFYAFWHTEEVNPSYSIEKPKEHLSHKENISRKIDTTSNSLIKEEVIPFQTAKKMEIQTQVVYETLMPQSHEETMQEANEAFDILDSEMEEIEGKLAEIEQEKEESMRIEMETQQLETDTYYDRL